MTNTTPASGATGVSRKGSIVLTFSTTLDPFNTGMNNITLTTAAGNQPVLAAVAGNTVTIVPIGALPPLVSFRITIGTGLHGTNGESLTAPIVLNYTTADREWQTPTRLEPTGPTTTERPRLAVDGLGNVLAVWQRRDGTTRSIWSNHYSTVNGWGTPVQISTLVSAQTGAEEPEVAVDVSGNAIVVWQQSDNGVTRVWANRAIGGTDWATASQIQTGTPMTADGEAPHVAMDAQGNALAVWTQFEGGQFQIWSNRFTAGPAGGWGTAVPAETTPGNAENARVAFDLTTGRAFAVWTQGVGTCFCVWANQFTATGGWETPRMIAGGTAINAFLPQIAVDGFGNAYAAWTESDDGQHSDIWSNRFTAGGDWGTAAMIDDRAGGSGPPKIVADLNGNAYAVWEQTQATVPGPTIRFNVYRAGTGWGAAGLIASATDVASGTGGNPDVAFDPNGVAHVAWEHDDGTQIHVRSSRLLPLATDWTPPLDARNTDSVTEPRLVVDANGDVTAVWEQVDGAGVAVFANRFE